MVVSSYLKNMYPENNSKRTLRIGRAPKGNHGLPTIHFQVRAELLVLERVVKLDHFPKVGVKQTFETTT